MILFPAIDILDGQVVRLAQGSYDEVTRYHTDPVEQALSFAEAGASWIHIVDLDGAKKGITQNYRVIEEILQNVKIGIEVGGGMRTLEGIASYVEAGARRIVLGTKLATDPSFVDDAVREFGDALVAGIDAKDGMVAISGWTEQRDLRADDLVARLQDMGIHHLVYTDIANDGMQTGIDAERYAELARIAGFPVVASGGVSSLHDFEALAAKGPAIEGVIVGRALYEGNFDLRQALAACEGKAQ